MIFTTTVRDKRRIVLAHGKLVTVQICDCGEDNGENQRTAEMIADALTVLHCDYLWGLGPGMSVSPIEPMVWLMVKGLPVGFEGATLEQALHGAARRIRGEE